MRTSRQSRYLIRIILQRFTWEHAEIGRLWRARLSRVADLDEAGVLALFDQLSNWGRWGPDDQIGCLNLITAEKRIEAAREVRDGIVIGCARVIRSEPFAADVSNPPLHYMLRTGENLSATSSSDFVGFVTHGTTISHLD